MRLIGESSYTLEAIHEMMNDLVKIIDERSNVQFEAKASATGYRERLAGIDSRVSSLASRIDDAIWEEYEPEETDGHDANTIVQRNRLTGEERTRPRTFAERQGTLPLEDDDRPDTDSPVVPLEDMDDIPTISRDILRTALSSEPKRIGEIDGGGLDRKTIKATLATMIDAGEVIKEGAKRSTTYRLAGAQ